MTIVLCIIKNDMIVYISFSLIMHTFELKLLRSRMSMLTPNFFDLRVALDGGLTIEYRGKDHFGA